MIPVVSLSSCLLRCEPRVEPMVGIWDRMYIGLVFSIFFVGRAERGVVRRRLRRLVEGIGLGRALTQEAIGKGPLLLVTSRKRYGQICVKI